MGHPQEVARLLRVDGASEWQLPEESRSMIPWGQQDSNRAPTH